MENKQALMRKIGGIAHTLLLVISAFWFGFSLLSGAESLGGGVMGVLRNSPNALPWFFLLILLYLYHHYPIVTSSLIILLGGVSIFFYNAPASPFVLFVITLPVLILGILLLWSGIVLHRSKESAAE